ncbi:pyridoxal phosphate-dependent transferase [Xylogone sp. PMI_703]|nr:pyridoxal phosphate-dependent transferase [Xylogone sp. PMI_703]
MTVKPPFGRSMRQAHFRFHPSYTPLNHGSFGAYPDVVQEHQDALTRLCHERPDTFLVYDLPDRVDESRRAIAPLLGVDVEEVVFVPNATTGVNTVLRNFQWGKGDVVVHFSTIYGACHKTLASIQEQEPLETVCIDLEYPVEDEDIVKRLRETVKRVRDEGKNVRLAMFDTVLTFPGARMPWEELVKACKEMEVLSLIDGAHGIGHIDLAHLGSVGPDFFVSNCHKWLYTPRGCAVFHVPLRNQHLIRTCFPTSHGYQYLSGPPDQTRKSRFVYLFEFVATTDYTPYFCVPAAIKFRKEICGGEEAIRKYCFDLARAGGQRVAETLGTHVMDTTTGTMRGCCFANVELPFKFANNKEEGSKEVEGKRVFSAEDAGKIQKWLNLTAVKEFDTYLQIAFHAGILWVRLSAQIYLEMDSFEWIGVKLKELCERVNKGEVHL